MAEYEKMQNISKKPIYQLPASVLPFLALASIWGNIFIEKIAVTTVRNEVVFISPKKGKQL